MSTSAQQKIAEHQKAIEQIIATQFTQDIIDVLQNKRHTPEELYTVCKAYVNNHMAKFRKENLKKARESREAKATVPVAQ